HLRIELVRLLARCRLELLLDVPGAHRGVLLFGLPEVGEDGFDLLVPFLVGLGAVFGLDRLPDELEQEIGATEHLHLLLHLGGLAADPHHPGPHWAAHAAHPPHHAFHHAAAAAHHHPGATHRAHAAPGAHADPHHRLHHPLHPGAHAA